MLKKPEKHMSAHIEIKSEMLSVFLDFIARNLATLPCDLDSFSC